MKRNPVPLAIVVTCHEPYLRFLPDCLESIDGQAPPETIKVLALDDCPGEADAALRGWQVVRGNWRSPAAARNACLPLLPEGGWVVFWDADNLMPERYLATGLEAVIAASDDTGILYPLVRNGNSLRFMGDDVAGDPRLGPHIDTCSFWRLRAIRHAGDWRKGLNRLDDYELGNRILRAGWKHAKLNTIVDQREHPLRRSHGADYHDALWEVRSLGIVVLLRGEGKLLPRWIEVASEIKLPPRAGLTVVDDSGTVTFGRKVRAMINRLSDRFQRVTLMTKGDSKPRNPSFSEIHDRVGHLYSRALPATPEDLILTWEDDVFPNQPDAIRELAWHLPPQRQRAAIGAVYESRANPGFAVAARGPKGWSGPFRLDRLPKRPFTVGMIGGGFTLWLKPVLDQHPVLGSWEVPELGEHQLGWDGFLCRRLNAAGWHVALHGGIRCDHFPP